MLILLVPDVVLLVAFLANPGGRDFACCWFSAIAFFFYS